MKKELNRIGINKVYDFIKNTNEDLVVKENLLDPITPWMIR